MMIKEPIKTSRDVDVVQIPEGYKIRLARGTQVRLMQALGDTFTVMSEYGTMLRVAGQDADAIGETAPASGASTVSEAQAPSTADEVKDRVWTALRGVYDPEIPVNVVELGLVYQCDVTPIQDGGYRANVRMTLTAPGCGMGGVLKEDAERRILAIPGIKTAVVDMVVDPPWNQSMMSDAARLELGL